MPDVYDPSTTWWWTPRSATTASPPPTSTTSCAPATIDTLLLTGVNTNSCVLATTVAGNTRDYAVIVVEECVDTMDPAMHQAALAVIRQAFGWVATTDEVVRALDAVVAAL